MTSLAAYDWHAFFFVLFALVTCGFGAAVLFTSNIVRMAFYLTLSLGSTAGLFFLAGAEFVGAMQLMIYVGGTLVLLIFGVMLTAQSRFINIQTSGGEWVMALILGGALLLLLLQTALSVPGWRAPHPQRALLASAATLDQAAHHARAIHTSATAAATDEGISERRITAMDGLLQQIHEEYSEVWELHGDVGGLKLAVQALQTQEQALQERLKAARESAEADVAARQLAAREVKDAADRLATELTGASQVLDAEAAATGVSLADSKTTSQLGLALTSVRVDREQQPSPVLRNGMSGYLLPFVIVSIHLLVVLIGAAYMARTKRRASESTGG